MKNKKRLLWQLPFLTFLIIGTVIIVGRQNNAEYRNNHGMIFGTTYNITYQSEQNLEQGMKAVLQEVDNALSPFNPKSVITAVNENRTVKLNAMFTEVYRRAMEISAVTDGAFDITVA
ncbi:MAG: FAD:protein FMN transferase, partial [Prevotella sp.]|nr:FAD:protein FMN transferase [Prevotella sp.]